MRLEPATRAASFVDVQHAFSFARDEGDARDGLRTLGGVHPCVRCESRTRSHCDGQRLSLPRGRLPEEAATPGQSARAERVLTNPRQIHPREPAGTADAIAMLQAANITRFNVSTLLEEAMRRNRKTRRLCAEAVEDRNFLWNAQENEKQILLSRVFCNFPGAEKRELSVSVRRCRTSQQKGARLLAPRKFANCPVRLVAHAIHERSQFSRTRRVTQLA